MKKKGKEGKLVWWSRNSSLRNTKQMFYQLRYMYQMNSSSPVTGTMVKGRLSSENDIEDNF